MISQLLPIPTDNQLTPDKNMPNMRNMQIITNMLLALLLLGHVTAHNDEAIEKELAESLVNSFVGSADAVSLLYNIFLQITHYECNRHQTDCRAWTAVNLIEALELLGVNCDGNHDNHGLCTRARTFLGSEDVGHDDIIKGLLVIGEQVPSRDYPALNAIRDSVIDYVCLKEPRECEVLGLVNSKYY